MQGSRVLLCGGLSAGLAQAQKYQCRFLVLIAQLLSSVQAKTTSLSFFPPIERSGRSFSLNKTIGLTMSLHISQVGYYCKYFPWSINSFNLDPPSNTRQCPWRCDPLFVPFPKSHPHHHVPSRSHHWAKYARLLIWAANGNNLCVVWSWLISCALCLTDSAKQREREEKVRMAREAQEQERKRKLQELIEGQKKAQEWV